MQTNDNDWRLSVPYKKELIKIYSRSINTFLYSMCQLLRFRNSCLQYS